ncbi:MAG: Cytidylate kinase [uncultured Gemmatimonadaceae bacterium]|uniref:Cytidylate kinase n=1 Tax=uncultured Gemmatimonadaceae bacterium TaxID=246130 RepID=A0A6J4LPB8_9BACT|nr:MAG: Cytidylate kinase [uncultured Gemmatimonadaceae bacterium]
MSGPAGAVPMTVAIDGPAASGKSSTAKWVAERLGFRHVDSGALYRAATAMALRTATPPEAWTPELVLGGVGAIALRPSANSFDVHAGGESLEATMRGAEVTRNVSRVAQMAAVRGWVNAQVRAAARGHSVVVDGRDIGTAVFPEADLKIFLVADPWERARRRLVQQLGRRPTDEEVAEETGRLVQRDAKDQTQTVQAPDAVLIDTTYLTQTEQVERIVALARSVAPRGVAESPVDASGPIG